MISSAEFVLLSPEILMAAGALLLLMYGVFAGDRVSGTANLVGMIYCIIAAFLVWQMPDQRQYYLNGFLVHDSFASYVKVVVLLGSGLALFMADAYARRHSIARPELAVLIMLAALGMMLMISAHDLLSLYMALELQALALYVLAAFQRDRLASSEAGLKYFVLGALSSGLMLYGMSLLYGSFGSTDYLVLASSLSQGGALPMPVLFGLVFVCAAMAFKVSAVPFHMWAPDVYQGAPTPVTAYFAAAPKVAAMAVFARLLLEPLMGAFNDWQQIIIFLSLASMILGGFAAITQTNIKRLMAYSSIAHVGYGLVGLAAGTAEGLQGLLVYLAIYFLNTLGTFAVILCLRHNGTAVENLSDLKGLSKTRPLLALALTINMFSLAGVPPLAGFFGKFYVFMAAAEAQLIWLALVGLLMSAVACYYYIRIVKLVYFDEPDHGTDAVSEIGLRAVIAISAGYMVLFCVAPQPIIGTALEAARGLLLR